MKTILLTLALAACAANDATTCAALPAPATTATADDVKAILAGNCALGGCHLSAPGAGRLVLDVSSPRWMDTVVNVRAKEVPALALVAPGDPDQSWLVHKVFGDFCGTACTGCGGPMPPGGSLSDADRQAIVAWIADGANP